MERDRTIRRFVVKIAISIHALRMERDDPTAYLAMRNIISIHALRMERDSKLTKASQVIDKFQSMRSAWSATKLGCPFA